MIRFQQLFYEPGRFSFSSHPPRGPEYYSLRLGRAFRLPAVRPPISSGGLRQLQSRQPQQVIRPRHKVTPRLSPLGSPIPAAPQATHGLHPTEDLFHPLPNSLAGLIPRLCRGAPIQPRGLNAHLTGDVRRDLPLATTAYKGFLVIVLVRPDGLGRGALVQLHMLVQLAQGQHRLRFADGIVDGEVGTQSMAVLHQEVATKTQPGFFAVGLAIEHAGRIGRALMRVVAPLFTMEVHGRIARVIVLGGVNLAGVGSILANEAFQTGPRFNECAVGGEMLVAGPALLPGNIVDFGKEELGHVSGEHALIVLRKDTVVEATLGKLAVEKPQPEQVVAELLTEQPFAADGVESGQHAGLEQLLRRDAGPPQFLVQGVEQWREPLQDGIQAALDGTQRMIGGHAVIEVNDRQKVRLGLRFSTHPSLTPIQSQRSNSPETFSTAW